MTWRVSETPTPLNNGWAVWWEQLSSIVEPHDVARGGRLLPPDPGQSKGTNKSKKKISSRVYGSVFLNKPKLSLPSSEFRRGKPGGPRVPTPRAGHI